MPRRDTENEAKRYRAAHKLVTCDHCERDRFYESSSLLNTAMATFLGFDWANRSALILTCEACGRIHWFQNIGRPVAAEGTVPLSDPFDSKRDQSLWSRLTSKLK